MIRQNNLKQNPYCRRKYVAFTGVKEEKRSFNERRGICFSKELTTIWFEAWNECSKCSKNYCLRWKYERRLPLFHFTSTNMVWSATSVWDAVFALLKTVDTCVEKLLRLQHGYTILTGWNTDNEINEDGFLNIINSFYCDKDWKAK